MAWWKKLGVVICGDGLAVGWWFDNNNKMVKEVGDGSKTFFWTDVWKGVWRWLSGLRGCMSWRRINSLRLLICSI